MIHILCAIYLFLFLHIVGCQQTKLFSDVTDVREHVNDSAILSIRNWVKAHEGDLTSGSCKPLIGVLLMAAATPPGTHQIAIAETLDTVTALPSFNVDPVCQYLVDFAVDTYRKAIKHSETCSACVYGCCPVSKMCLQKGEKCCHTTPCAGDAVCCYESVSKMPWCCPTGQKCSRVVNSCDKTEL